ADYNRPITYISTWYPGFYTGKNGENLQFMPGWTPHGVLSDLTFWVTHFHRPAHYFEQSGFQPDGTVSHHLPGSSDIAMHAYGYGWLTEVIDGYNLLRDMPVDLGSHGYQFISDRFLYTYDKMIYNGAMDFAVCGRSYSGDMAKFVDGMPEDLDDLFNAKQSSTVITNEAELKTWRDSLVNKTHVRTGNYPFWVGQFMVHRRGENGEKPHYYSVKMKNDRTCGAEDFEKVGKAYHSGSGILQAKVRGDEYEETRSSWDWHALPGLTEEWRTDKIPIKYDIHRGGSPFAGMASDGRYGFAAMEYRAQPNQYASARADKAYFFTETEAVAMGCNVERENPGQGREIITTIDQTLWLDDITYSINGAKPVRIKQGESVDLTLNPTRPSWIHQGQVGYVLIPQGAQPLYIRGGDAVQVTDPKSAGGEAVIHFALGHGSNPSKSGLTRYVYIVAANKTAAEMPDYMEDVLRRISVLSNGDGIQGVADSSLGLVQLAFYKAGTLSTEDGLTVSADRPALLQLRPVDGWWSFCATDPLHDKEAKELNLKISLPLAPGVYNYQLGGIYPRPGEAVTVEAFGKGVRVNVQLPDMSNDAEYNYQAPLYAGMPVHVSIPAGTK
ncbi:MAG: silent information regulator protein Sir2, partial [Verrucomicrobia bacterium]|nr:silent information regulator protein Sir2 [Verrucomicrobiota bacterium]